MFVVFALDGFLPFALKKTSKFLGLGQGTVVLYVANIRTNSCTELALNPETLDVGSVRIRI